MTKTAPFLLSLFTMSVLCSSVVAYAGQTTSERAAGIDHLDASTTSTTSAHRSDADRGAGER